MNIAIIKDFQIFLNNLLVSSNYIAENVRAIRFAPTNETNFPFIYCEMKKVSNICNIRNGQMEIDFSINIFSRQNNNNQILNIADAVTNRLSLSYMPEKFEIAGLNYHDAIFTCAPMGGTKLSITCKALIS